MSGSLSPAIHVIIKLTSKILVKYQPNVQVLAWNCYKANLLYLRNYALSKSLSTHNLKITWLAIIAGLNAYLTVLIDEST